MNGSFFARAGFVALLFALAAGPALAQDMPQLQTNQSYVEDVTRATTLNVGDPMAVFGYVLSKLPERVKVYPTENYYYFGFMHNGIRYAGNIRLDASNRDDGKVIFAYFEDTSQWYDEAPVEHAVLDASQGVMVEKVEPLVYRISYQGKSVVFALNDLRNVKPPAGSLGPGETFIGPIFDEAGQHIRTLLWRQSLRRTVVPDEMNERPPRIGLLGDDGLHRGQSKHDVEAVTIVQGGVADLHRADGRNGVCLLECCRPGGP